MNFHEKHFSIKFYKDLNSTYRMPKRDLIKSELGLNIKKKVKTSTVKGTITVEQRKILQNFIGIIGSNEQDVVGKILTLWMYNEGYLDVGKKGSLKK